MKMRLVLVLILALAACSDDVPTASTTSSSMLPPIVTTTSSIPTATSSAGTSTTSGATSSTSFATTTTLPALTDFELDVELVSDAFVQPILATTRPGDDRLVVVEQGGQIQALDLESGGISTLLDIADRVRWNGEQGLLGIAFHPDDAQRLLVHYSAVDGATTIEEYRVEPSSGVADPDSGRLILSRTQPASNHNGGMIAFGPDGYLWVALGDGGAANDRFDNGQNPSTILGAIIRISVDEGDPYAVPADNPFVNGDEGAPEVWAWGLRNPWRFAFDGTDLWVGDVGQGRWEEIDLFDARRPGDNAGWPLLEGTHCFRFADCDPSTFLAPVFEYSHEAGRCSVTGGIVYRGSALPHLVGTYLFGDYCSGDIWGLRIADDPRPRLFTDPDGGHLPALNGLTSFGIGPDGEAYVMQASGQVWRLISSG